MEQPKIKLNGFEYTLEDDQWIYKAIPFAIPKIKRPERPQYKVIEQVEESYIKLFDKMLAQTSKDITRYLAV